MRTLTGAVALALVAGAAVTGCGNLDVGTDGRENSYKITERVDGVRVTGGGSVAVTGTDSPGVHVVEKLRWSNDSNKPRTTHKVNGGTLDLTARCGRQVIGFNACGVSYEIQVPKKSAVNIDSDDGGITVTGLAGTVKLHTDTGLIKALDLDTTRLDASTNDGMIKLSGRADTAELRTDTGKIDASALRSTTVDARTDDGAIKLTFAAPPTAVQARTDTGTVRLLVPTSVPYAVKMSTDTGSKRVDPAVRTDSGAKHRITATTQDGGVSVGPA